MKNDCDNFSLIKLTSRFDCLVLRGYYDSSLVSHLAWLKCSMMVIVIHTFVQVGE